jgi:hypothetical protein
VKYENLVTPLDRNNANMGRKGCLDFGTLIPTLKLAFNLSDAGMRLRTRMVNCT